MGGFFKGLSEGVDSGLKLGNAWNDASMRREIKDANSTAQSQDPQYTQDQAAQLRDPAEAAGGVWDENSQSYKMPNGDFVAPAAAPTYSNGHYSLANGTAVAPKNRFSLGNKTQDTAFSADDIANEKLNRKADIYSSYGKEDLAEQMRSNALSRQVAGLQIKKAQGEDDDLQKWKAAQATGEKYTTEAHALLADVTDKVNSGAMPIQQGVAQLLDHNSKSLPDGKSYSIDPVKGTLFLTQNGKTSTVTGHDGKPIVADQAHLPEIGGLIEGKTQSYLQQQFLATHPNAWMQGQELAQTKENADRTYTAGRQDQADNLGIKQGELSVQQATQAATQKNQEAEIGIKTAAQRSQDMYYRGILSKGNEATPLNASQAFDLEQRKQYAVKVNAIQNDVESGKITETEGNKRMNSVNRRLGFNPTADKADKAPKPWTTSDEKNLGEILNNTEGWSKMPIETRQRLYKEKKAEFIGGSQESAGGGLLDVAKNMKAPPQESQNSASGKIRPADSMSAYGLKHPMYPVKILPSTDNGSHFEDGLLVPNTKR